MHRGKNIFLTAVAFMMCLAVPLRAQQTRDALADAKAAAVADQLLVSAVGLYSDGKYQDAYNILSQAAKVNPGNDAVHFYLGNILSMSSRREEAMEHFREAYEIDPSNMWYGLHLATTLNELQRPSEALEILENLQKIKPSSPDVMSAMLDAHLMTGEIERADSLLRKVEVMMGESDYTRLTRLEILRQKGDFTAFFASLGNLFSEGYMPAASKIDLMKRVMRSSDPRFNYAHLQDYVNLVEICLDRHPADTSVTHYAVGLYYSADRKGEIIRLAQLHPDDPYMIESAITVHYQQGDFKAMLKDTDRMIALCGDNPEAVAKAYSAKGDAYTQLGQADRAIREYERALEILPDDIGIMNNCAYLMACEGKNLAKCAKMSKKTIEAEPENATYLDTYAWILYKQKKYSLAKSYFKKALMYGGKNSAAVLEHYALTLEALGDTTLAKAYMEQARMKKNAQK